MGKAYGCVKVGAGELGRQEGAVEGIPGRRGIHRLDPKTRHERLFLPLAAIDPLRPQGDHHLTDAHLVEAGGSLPGARFVRHLDAGQQLGLGLVGGDEVHQRQQIP